MQHGLYLFTCEISPVDNRSLRKPGIQVKWWIVSMPANGHAWPYNGSQGPLSLQSSCGKPCCIFQVQGGLPAGAPGSRDPMDSWSRGTPGPVSPRILSRVGDRPIATILHAQFHFFDFSSGFSSQNVQPKYAPPRKTNYTLKWKGGEAAPLIYFIFTPSRRGIFWSNISLEKP